MDIVTLSPKYQVVIPQRIRKLLNLKPGEKLQVISYDNRIEFVLVRYMKSMKGFLKGLNSDFSREKDDRV